MSRVITALFHSRVAAERARRGLVELGVRREQVTLHGTGEPPAVPATGAAPGGEPGLPGLLAALFLPAREVVAHREALRHGHVVLAAAVEPADAERVQKALDAAGAEDLEQHAPEDAPDEPHGDEATRRLRPKARRLPSPGRARTYAIEAPLAEEADLAEQMTATPAGRRRP